MVRGFRPTRTLVTALTACFVAIMALAAFGVLLGLAEALFFPEADGDESTGATVLLLAQLFHVLLYLAVYAVATVLFCVFVHRSNRNARALGAKEMEYTPGWAVGWFFVPIAQLFKPYQAVREIHLASDPDAGPGDWRGRPAPAVLSAWWAVYVVSNLAGAISLRVLLSRDAAVRALSPWFDVLDGLLEIPLCLLALAVVRGIHQRQTAKADRALPPAA
jgi:hypothetical protein